MLFQRLPEVLPHAWKGKIRGWLLSWWRSATSMLDASKPTHAGSPGELICVNWECLMSGVTVGIAFRLFNFRE